MTLPSRSNALRATSDTCHSPRSIISCAGTKLRTSRRILITTCSATETTFEPDTSRTWMPFSTAALRSMWSEPTPAVIQIFRFFA